jgi:hypothetical protein
MSSSSASPTRSYSVWAIPSSKTEPRLTSLITSLAGKHSTVTFPPHITLLGDIRTDLGQGKVEEAVEKALRSSSPSFFVGTAAASESSQHLSVRFARAAAGSLFYRCVYALCELEPALVAANASLQAAFGHDESFMPHLSLLYGDVCESAEKTEAIRASVEAEVKEVGGVEVGRIELWETTAHLRGASTHEGRWALLKAWDVMGS